jgi:uncharacterized protein YgbK (DUF1537 family)
MYTNKTRYTMLADDISGAADSCYCMTQLSNACVVTLQPDTFPFTEDVVYIGVTNDRGMRSDALTARWAKWEQFVRTGLSQGEMILKVDSLGRGSWPERLRQMLTLEEAPQICLLVPAIPPAGRTTVNGDQFLHGVPIDQTEAANDPTSPIVSASITELARGAWEDVQLLSLQDVRQGSAHIAETLRLVARRAGLHTIIVADAETLDDIRVLIQGVRRAQISPLWAGATSLFEMLAEAEVQQDREHGVYLTGALPHNLTDEPTLYVVGSLSPIVRAEIQDIQVSTVQIVPQVGLVVEKDGEKDPLSGGDLAALTPLAGDGYHWEDVLLEVQSVITDLFKAHSWGLLVVTGGDTTAAVVEGLHGWGLQLVSRVNVGTVFCTILGGPYEGFPLITKVGSMGSLRIVRVGNTVSVVTAAGEKKENVS